MRKHGRHFVKKIERRILRGFVVFFALVILLFSIAVYVFLDPFLKNRIIYGVHNSSHGMYVLEIGNFKTQFWSGAISMKNVWLRPDASYLSRLKKDGASSVPPDLSFQIDSVNISSIRWIRYLLNNEKLEIGRVRIQLPQLVFTGHLNENIREGNENFLNVLPGIIAAFTGSLRIDELDINNGNVNLDLITREGLIKQRADSIFVNLEHIVIDTLSERQALYSETAYLDVHNYELRTPGNIHRLDIRRVYGRVEDSTLNIDKIVYSTKDTAKNNFPDEVDVKMNSIRARGINYRDLLRSQKIYVRAVRLDAPDVHLASALDPDRRYRASDNNSDSSILDKIVPYISGSFRIDTLGIDNGAFRYHIHNKSKNIFQSAHSIYLNFTRVLVDTNSTHSKLYVEDMNVQLRDYKLEQDKATALHVSFIKASVKDSLLLLKKLSFSNEDGATYKVAANHVLGEGLDYLKIIRTKKADFRRMIVASPDIHLQTVSHKNKRKEKKAAYTSPRNFFQKALGPLADAGFNTKQLILKNGKFFHSIKSDSGIIDHKADNIFLSVFNVRVDSASAQRYNFYDSLTCTLNDYHINIHKENFGIHVKDFAASSFRQKIDLNEIVITQIHSFGPTQRHYFINNIKYAVVNGFDFNRFIVNQQPHARKLDIHEMSLRVFLDGGKPERPAIASKMPQELIQGLPFYLRVDTLRIQNSSITYADQEPKIRNPGRLTFERIDATGYNFTNDHSLMTDATPAVLYGQMYLMGEGLMKFRVTMPLLSPTFDAYYSGTLDGMSGDKFNSMLIFADMKVTEGRILPSEFSVEVINGSAIGRLKFVYEDLHVKVTKTGNEDEVSKLKSLLGNIVVKNGNPKDKDDGPEVVPLCGKRVPDDSFFSFVWKILKDGIIQTVTKDSLYNIVKAKQ